VIVIRWVRCLELILATPLTDSVTAKDTQVVEDATCVWLVTITLILNYCKLKSGAYQG